MGQQHHVRPAGPGDVVLARKYPFDEPHTFQRAQGGFRFDRALIPAAIKNLDDELGVQPVTPAKLDRPGQEVKTLIAHRVTETSHAYGALHCSLRSRIAKRER